MATRSGQRSVVAGRSPHNSAVKGVKSEPTLKTSTISGPRHGRPSDRLNPKTIDPFGSSKKSKSAFAAVYNNGGIPCRLVHGSVKHKLSWNTPPEDVTFDTILVTLAQGLQETVHPYTFVARQGFKELLQIADADVRTQPLLGKLSVSLRGALGHSAADVFEAGFDSLIQLSAVVGPALNPHLKTLLIPIAKRMMEKKYRERITDGLQQLEQNGGQEAKLVIKAKIPTYHSVT